MKHLRCAAAQISRIPIAHIHGGESTEGAIDEAFSITKCHTYTSQQQKFTERESFSLAKLLIEI